MYLEKLGVYQASPKQKYKIIRPWKYHSRCRGVEGERCKQFHCLPPLERRAKNRDKAVLQGRQLLTQIRDNKSWRHLASFASAHHSKDLVHSKISIFLFLYLCTLGLLLLTQNMFDISLKNKEI